jgi:DNA-binding response OmpR family regulator
LHVFESSEHASLDRRAPIILLIEDDEADRLTLTRMLGNCGYKVMAASRGARALNTFVIHHGHIAVVLLSEQLSDYASGGLVDALYRIDRRVPVLTARYPSRGLSAGRDAERSLAFAELVADVQSRLQTTRPAAKKHYSALDADSTPVAAATFFTDDSAVRLSGRAHRKFRWPLRDDEVDEIEWGTASEDAAVTSQLLADRELRTRVLQSDRLLPIATPNRRRYLARLNRERALRRRIAGIGMTVAGSALIATALLEMRRNTTGAISADATVTVPLAGTPISEHAGIVHLVSAARANRSSLADELLPTLVGPR